MLSLYELDELTNYGPDQRKRAEDYFVGLRTNELALQRLPRSEDYFVNSSSSSTPHKNWSREEAK